jgi:hypothetical protein
LEKGMRVTYFFLLSFSGAGECLYLSQKHWLKM